MCIQYIVNAHVGYDQVEGSYPCVWALLAQSLALASGDTGTDVRITSSNRGGIFENLESTKYTSASTVSGSSGGAGGS